MGKSSNTLESDTDSGIAISLAKTLAPEELRVGDYVAVLRITYEVPSFVWCCHDSFADRSDLVRLHMLPDDEAVPLEVEAVCLPFVLAKPPKGPPRTLDIRRVQLARLARRFAQASQQAHKRHSSHGKKKSRKGRKKR